MREEFSDGKRYAMFEGTRKFPGQENDLRTKDCDERTDCGGQSD